MFVGCFVVNQIYQRISEHNRIKKCIYLNKVCFVPCPVNCFGLCLGLVIKCKKYYKHETSCLYETLYCLET